MNTKTHTSTGRTTALTACFLLLVAGATACGTDEGTAPAGASSRHSVAAGQPTGRGPARTPQPTLTTVDLAENARAYQAARELKRAQHADAARRRHGYGDDMRHPLAQTP